MLMLMMKMPAILRNFTYFSSIFSRMSEQDVLLTVFFLSIWMKGMLDVISKGYKMCSYMFVCLVYAAICVMEWREAVLYEITG